MCPKTERAHARGARTEPRTRGEACTTLLGDVLFNILLFFLLVF